MCIRERFNEMFQSFDKSPAYQLKKHYPDIYEKIMKTEIENYSKIFKQKDVYKRQVSYQAFKYCSESACFSQYSRSVLFSIIRFICSIIKQIYKKFSKQKLEAIVF